jgi:tetraacyldisaccharide 4'-kinase
MTAERVQELLLALLNRVWYEAHPARWLLWPVSALYELAVTLRRQAYRRGWLAVVEVAVPVIVVGNISVGGTGKTPFIIWLADQLRRRRLRVGILARGYRGSAQTWPQLVQGGSDARIVGDEPVLLARRTGCPVVAGPDRVAAAQHLLKHAQVDVLLSDDGLQHYRLARRLEVAVVDGTRGMGNGLCLPAGPLREPVTRVNEVDAIVVNGGDWGHAGVFKGTPRVSEVRQLAGGALRTLDSFKGKPVHAVAGIGNPQRFFDLLEDAGLEVIPHPLPDHADVDAENLRFTEPGSVLVTEKDAVKCEGVAHADVWCVAVDLMFDADTGARLLRVLTRDLDATAR